MKELLRRYWGYDSFRGIQQEIIESICEGHDTLGLMPTGGGKSITFQVPALAKEGVCLVITPLIALMKDQVQNLRKRGIRAAAIYSGLSHDDTLRILENTIFGAVKLLYISPERLSSELFQKKLSHMKVSFICVDEAHCISQWGYDFRPSYLEIAKVRQMLPEAPVLALTATATPQVVEDIQRQLAFRSPRVFRMSFERKNLSYKVERTTDKPQHLIHILNEIPGSAIVYARSRQRTKEYAETLQAAGIKAEYYHAGLDNAEKDRIQHEWQSDKIRVIVATNAFGMGIDKPDVRLVAHVDCPDSIEAYFQEAGRAGRDGKDAYAILLYDGSEATKLQHRISDTWPEKDYIRQVYDHLAYFFQIAVGSGFNATFEFPIDKFSYTFKHFPIRVEAALKILDRAGYIEYKEEDENRARVMFILDRDELYQLRGNTPEEEKVIIALLRNYSGLFSAFQYIDEAFIAQQTQLTTPIVYQTLKQLGQRHIINFIPQKKIPFIRYAQRREDSQFLVFPPAIYDELKERYTQRIKEMIRYATTTNVCRSRILLKYFGETVTHDCGRCDVCLTEQRTFPVDINQIKQHILCMIDKEKACSIQLLHTLPYPLNLIDQTIKMLIQEEIITDHDGTICF